jgi:Na+-driven multidrug efflux pump
LELKEQLLNLQLSFAPIIFYLPFLALCMMGNNIIRAEGKAKFKVIDDYSAFFNIGLDILLSK